MTSPSPDVKPSRRQVLKQSGAAALAFTILLSQDSSENKAIADLYVTALERLGVDVRIETTDSAQYVERASLESQRVLKLRDANDTAPYFSMILITKGSDPWLKSAL